MPVLNYRNFATFFLTAVLGVTLGLTPHTVLSASSLDTVVEPGDGLLTLEELDLVVGPIALYPDELIAIVLPASTFPLDIVKAARYLEKHKQNSEIKPSENWDSSVLGLLNYPEVINLMNEDLDWTWKLGTAVADQQKDVIDAIQQFRQRAYSAGNLKSSKQQVIVEEQQTIIIKSASPEVIYVPRYDPAVVVVHQPAPYPYYYSHPYPYYYSPAATFWTGMFVGAAIGYGVGWRHGDVNINRNVNVSGGNTNVNLNKGGNKWNSNRPGTGSRPGNRRPGGGYGSGQRPNQRLGSGQFSNKGQFGNSRQRLGS